MKRILDLCGGTGAWSRPYAEAGYDVLIIDPQDIRENTNAKQLPFDVENYLEWCLWAQSVSLGEQLPTQGILCAPPCTHFSGSGAQYWKAKDADGRTDEHLAIVDACLDIIELFDPVWWILENPVGRLPKLRPNRLGKPLMRFQPYEYGDPWTKRTCLWGNFTIPKQNVVEPIRSTKQGSWTQKLGGKSERTKRLRSITPQGFAKAFFEANP
jgi:site-specific DNA-cytosine methylase